jgi:transposase-like protein
MERIPRAVYTKELREEAVKLVTERELSIPEVGRRLSIATSTIRYWVKAASFEEVAVFNEECGVEEIGTPAKTLSGGFLLSTGELKRGLKMIEDCRKRFE